MPRKVHYAPFNANLNFILGKMSGEIVEFSALCNVRPKEIDI